jgi:hypothetical protein
LPISSARGVEGGNGVGDVTVGDVGDDRPVGGVADGERGAAVGLPPGAADEEAVVLGTQKI